MSISIALFQGKEVRKTIHNNEWWFVVADIVAILSNSTDSRQYLKKMRNRDQQLDEGWGQIVTLLTIETSKGPQRLNCTNAEGAFRIIQSIPSPKAEPFKRWLAKVGYERIQEIDDPELAMKRMRETYKAKGYSDDWIEKRVRGIAIREELTEEWHQRGADAQRDYQILTAEISKATFGVTPAEYKKLKGLKRENLRDHMDDFELIFNMLGERATTEIHRTEDSKGVEKLQSDAKAGGDIAGGARKNLEKRLGRSIVTKKNFLP
jgi:DNA-damage-inducible protein D